MLADAASVESTHQAAQDSNAISALRCTSSTVHSSAAVGQPVVLSNSNRAEGRTLGCAILGWDEHGANEIRALKRRRRRNDARTQSAIDSTSDTDSEASTSSWQHKRARNGEPPLPPGPPPNPAHELLFEASAATLANQISDKMERKMGVPRAMQSLCVLTSNSLSLNFGSRARPCVPAVQDC